jgi:DNA (cytosine-5)-methyltransferase 1
VIAGTVDYKQNKMKEYKVLNLYACLGGNRYKWNEVAEEAGVDLKVTAVELDPELAKLYQERFPNDTVIVSDAHQYLLDHYKDFDFIWSSPPCPSHSGIRWKAKYKLDAIYPEMSLYQEIILLDKWFEGKYVVENVIPYYEPLIPAKKRGRHLYWTNFNLPNDIDSRKDANGLMDGAKDEVNLWCKFHDYDFYKYKGEQRRDKIARNLVDYKAGRTILEIALNIHKRKNSTQLSLI